MGGGGRGGRSRGGLPEGSSNALVPERCGI